MPNFFVDVRQDLAFVYGWPSRLVRPIWKVKRAPKRADPSLRRFSCAIAHDFLGNSDSDVKNAKFFHGRPSRPCLCIRLAITACSTQLEAHDFLGDPDSDVKNANFFRERLSRPCLCIRLAITACPTHLEAHDFLGDPDSDVKNAKFFRGLPSRPCLWVRLAVTACPTHLEGQTNPEASIPLISTILMCYSTRFFGPCLCKRLAITACPTHLEAHDFLGDPDSDVKNAKFFRGRPSRPCLCIHLTITDCPTHLHTIFWVIRIPTSKISNFFVDVRQDLFYEYGWTSRLVRPIWKVKRAPKRAYPSFRRFSCAIAHDFLGDPDSDVKNAKFFRGRPSRPCLCIRLAMTACPTHLEGQTSPEASIPLISTIFVCYSTRFFG
uniref:Uncharacterized protein n=1 Tax=Solanum lycopersicum TaxID=4081 RepID=A0A3Q7HXF1_SOLLC